MPDNPVEIAAVTTAQWPSVERLLASGRSSGSCWCQWFRLAPKDYDTGTADERREGLAERIAGGRSRALLATIAGEPVGWLSFGPVGEFQPRLERWSVAPRSFEPGAWAITCLFIREADRRGGVGARLIEAAVDAARSSGASALVAFPLLAPAGPGPRRAEGATGVGYVEQFLAAGFELRRGAIESRPLAVYRFAAGLAARIPGTGS